MKGYLGVSFMKVLAAVILLCVSGSWSLAKDEPQLRPMIVSMAQHFVQEHFMQGRSGHYHIEFDVAYLHPQPQPKFWAVVGGFVSDQNISNTYVAAVRQVCANISDVKCWRLEKLAINNEVILNTSPPL